MSNEAAREQRNAIFGADKDPAIQAVDRVKQELGMEVPVELVPLPSQGQVYPANSSLHKRDSVEITAMTTREEDLLMSPALIKKGTVITELLRSCLVDKSINVSDMISGDRNALMVAVRITGYGPEYEAEIECPKCQAKSKPTFMLDQLPIKRLGIKPVEEGQNCFEFVLPSSKATVHFKFLTGKDEEEIVLTQQRMKKVQASDTLVSTQLKYAILSVNGKTDRTLINAFVAKMPARDSLALREYINKNVPNVDMSQEFVCEECGATEEVEIPLGANFFWPNAK